MVTVLTGARFSWVVLIWPPMWILRLGWEPSVGFTHMSGAWTRASGAPQDGHSLYGLTTWS